MQKYITFIFVLFSIFLLTSAKNKQPKIKIVEDTTYQMVWSDEFNIDGKPDESKWTYDVGGHGWGNNELQYYTEGSPSNVYIKDSSLKILAQKEIFQKDGKQWKYTSTRLVSKNLADFQYGYFEIRAKIPYGRGSWPAIWMLPTAYIYGPWPSSGEIDIMEHVGSNPGVVVGSAHTEKYNHKIGTQKNAEIRVVDPSLNFYRYGIKWSADQIEWFVNDTKYFTFKNDHTDYKAWPFDNPFHLLLNIAVGGSWGGKVDDTMFPMVMEIDYVRVYQEKD